MDHRSRLTVSLFTYADPVSSMILAMDAQRRIEKTILAEHRLIATRLGPGVLGHARSNLRRWAERYAPDQRPGWMREWDALLKDDVRDERLIEVLTSDSEEAKRLRSSSPFAGVIAPQERWALHKAMRVRA